MRFIIKTILKLLLPLFTVALLSQCGDDEPNPVVTIPDSNFLSTLIDQGVDTNGDGIISPEEAEVIISLDVQGDSISDMTGIEAFVNLENLDCSDNQLSTLNVSHNTALTVLDLWNNQLTSIDVSNNTALTDLSCVSNQLTSLDVSNNTALTFLACGFNQLTSLDVSNNTALEFIRLSDMPSINEVCVWETPFPPDGVEVDVTNSRNVFFTTDCTGG